LPSNRVRQNLFPDARNVGGPGELKRRIKTKSRRPGNAYDLPRPKGV
jgi:hypothetical protein